MQTVSNHKNRETQRDKIGIKINKKEKANESKRQGWELPG